MQLLFVETHRKSIIKLAINSNRFVLAQKMLYIFSDWHKLYCVPRTISSAALASRWICIWQAQSTTGNLRHSKSVDSFFFLVVFVYLFAFAFRVYDSFKSSNTIRCFFCVPQLIVFNILSISDFGTFFMIVTFALMNARST